MCRFHSIFKKFIMFFLLFFFVFFHSVVANSICEKDICHCDGFGKVRCLCRFDHEETTVTVDGDYRILPTATEIEILNCSRASIQPNALMNLRDLRKINIYDVERLSLFENSFNWRYQPESVEMSMPGLQIGIHNTTILELPSQAFKGRIDYIFLNNSRFENVKPFAFSNFRGLKRIDIKDCDIRNLDTQIFKKFRVENVAIERTKFRNIPSRMFSDVDVQGEFKIKNITVNKIQSSSFILQDVNRLIIEDSTINVLEGDAFRVTSTGPVLFKSNTINTMNLGAFAGLTLSSLPTVYGPFDFVFENITLTNVMTESLRIDFKSYNLIIKHLHVNQLCGCSSKTKDSLSYYEMNMYCFVHGSNSPNNKEYKSFKLYQEEYCDNKQLTLATILVISSSVILIVLIIIVLIVCFLIQKNKKGFAWINSKNSEKNTNTDKEFPVILPDGRTYRETELHVIVERAQLLTTDL